MDRIIRRVTRSVVPVAATPKTVSAATDNVAAEDRITDALKSIAKLQRVLAETAKAIDVQEEVIKKDMLFLKKGAFTDGVLEAQIVTTFSNEKKEVDAKTLFNHKGFTREDFFSVVKVQIGELAKFMAENELKTIAKITPPKKTGTALKIKAVKTEVVKKPRSAK